MQGDVEGVELKGSEFTLTAKAQNFVSPDPDLATCVKKGVKEEKMTHFDLNPKAARLGEYWSKG
jgi:hypothetical protein